jgi:uncharacterized membrane protein YgcG
MINKYMVFAVIVALACSLGSWSGLARRAMGGQGSGNSWHTLSSGSGYSGGGWASGGGGGHK